MPNTILKRCLFAMSKGFVLSFLYIERKIDIEIVSDSYIFIHIKAQIKHAYVNLSTI